MNLESWTGDDATSRPVLVQRFPAGWRAISTAVVGGGTGALSWCLNAQVSQRYFHPDPVAHAGQIAVQCGLTGPGVAMLTAARVQQATTATDGGVVAVATVGLGFPVWAAAPLGVLPPRVGTVNVVVTCPVPLSDAALVNAVVTATEAKTQALVEAGVPGSGTASDALCVACPEASDGDAQPYGGPRSEWGARIARAVHAAVAQGTADWLRRHPVGDAHRAGGWRTTAEA